MKTKICKNCPNNFDLSEGDLSYYEEMKVPEPTFCPDCRQQRRLAWRNERKLYVRKCNGTGETILSVYSEEKPFQIYKNEYWYSDKWDALTYGRDFDFNRPFFEQFKELMHSVPQLALSTVNNQNCDYVNQCGWCKDSYLIFEADFDEKCFYSSYIYDSKDCVDNVHCYQSELCYECTDVRNCYNLRFSQNCNTCSDSWFLKNCIGCSNCFGCVNLRNKQYYIYNKPYSKEGYVKQMETYNLIDVGSLQEFRQDFSEYSKQFPHKYLYGVQNENSTGDYMFNTQNCEQCFDINNAQDCKYIHNSRFIKKVHDMSTFGSKGGTEFCYENHEIGGARAGVRNICFSDQIWEGCCDIFYSKLCQQNSHDLLGCVGLRKAAHCIFNKQYSKDEYEVLRNKLIEHMKKTEEWGEFFPISLSPYGYNETLAQDYFPLSKEEALVKGYKWKDEEMKPTQAPTKELLLCPKCSKNFKLVNHELAFYQKQNLPPPLSCPDCRHKVRMSLRNPRKLWKRHCKQCEAPFETSYAPDRPEPIYCENCYLKLVD
mgnify:CR=1 FL=1